MENDTFTTDDQVRQVEYLENKEAGVIGCVFVTQRGQRIRVFFAKKDVPPFAEKLMERYRSALD